jgi:uncharacterized protein (DUF885 family)
MFQAKSPKQGMTTGLLFALTISAASSILSPRYTQAATAPEKTQSGNEDAKLKAFFATNWEANLTASPESASYNGDTRFDDRWTDQSLTAIKTREAADRAALVALRNFNRAKVSKASQLDYNTFAWLLECNVER